MNPFDLTAGAGGERIAVVTVVHGRHDHLALQHRSLGRSAVLLDDWVVVAMDDPWPARWRTGFPPTPHVVPVAGTEQGLPLAAARNLGARDFGLFSLALLLYSLLVPAVQAVVGQELQLRTGTDRERRRASASAVRASLLLGGVLGMLLLGVALVVPSSTGPVIALARQPTAPLPQPMSRT